MDPRASEIDISVWMGEHFAPLESLSSVSPKAEVDRYIASALVKAENLLQEAQRDHDRIMQQYGRPAEAMSTPLHGGDGAA
jgi:hypothetical protein